MMEREHAAFSMLDHFAVGPLQPLNFVESISRERFAAPKYDLLIHPGANAANRSWAAENFAAVVEKIPHQYRIVVLGLPAEIEGIRRVLVEDRGIEFVSGTLKEALIAIARARVVLALDSGAAHFAQCLNVPGVAIFGKSDPATIIGTKGSVVPIYEKKFSCQPCGKVECNQPEVYCMNTITPETVAQAVCNLLARSDRAI
jgi:heptosyltransferase-2